MSANEAEHRCSHLYRLLPATRFSAASLADGRYRRLAHEDMASHYAVSEKMQEPPA